eukprot:3941047-Rhodomonas_salina.1
MRYIAGETAAQSRNHFPLGWHPYAPPILTLPTRRFLPDHVQCMLWRQLAGVSTKHLSVHGKEVILQMYYGPLQRAYDHQVCTDACRAECKCSQEDTVTLNFFVDDSHAGSGSVDADVSDACTAGSVNTPMSPVGLSRVCSTLYHTPIWHSLDLAILCEEWYMPLQTVYNQSDEQDTMDLWAEDGFAAEEARSQQGVRRWNSL